ncbi:hypothetical protein BD410DRAFT_692068, partial [Rickenella mellea]
ISTNGRPLEFTRWIRDGRPYDQKPEIKDVPKYAEVWRGWWTNLQPKARVPSSSPAWPLLRINGLDWSKTRRGGSNGFLAIVMTLVWW